MTFWDWFNENMTKIFGYVTTLLGTLSALIATGSFDKLLSDTAVGWMGIIVAIGTAMVGGATAARGVNNTTKERVATAMQDAINATPGAPLPQNVRDQTIVKPEGSTS